MRAGGLTGTAAAEIDGACGLAALAPVGAAVGPGCRPRWLRWSVSGSSSRTGTAVLLTGRLAAWTRRVDGRGDRRPRVPRAGVWSSGPGSGTAELLTSSPTMVILSHLRPACPARGRSTG
ncbi:hypothetical protein GCM10009610_15190 [Pseudonocardia xinjiangensis]